MNKKHVKIDNRYRPIEMSNNKENTSKSWSLKGELILNCNCTVFCPCVISLGNHPPTEGYCQAWFGVRIDEGKFGDEDLSGINVAMLMDIPGKMARGNWKAALYVDESASELAYEGLVKIFSGRAKGTTGLFSILVSEFLGSKRILINDFSSKSSNVAIIGNLPINSGINPYFSKSSGSKLFIHSPVFLS